jgi:hypothetical protein
VKGVGFLSKRKLFIAIAILMIVIATGLFKIFVAPNTVRDAMNKAGIEQEIKVLQIKKISRDDALVFYNLKNLKGIQVALASKNIFGWEWESNFGDIRIITEVDDKITFEYISLPQQEFSILYGSINEPNVKKVTVGYTGTSEKIADLTEFNGNQRLWFTTLGLDERKIIVRAKNDKNDVILKKEF